MTPHSSLMLRAARPGTSWAWDLELVWGGTFVNSPESGEMDGLEAELRDAAARFGIPLSDEDEFGPSYPHGVIEEPDDAHSA